MNDTSLPFDTPFLDYLDYNEPTTFNYAKGFEGYDIQSNYLIQNYIPSNSFGMLFGGSGEFKSFCAASWACHVATGLDWNGHSVNQSGVLYIVGEGGIGMPKRFKAWADEYYESRDVPNLVRINQPVHMANDEQWMTLVNTINSLKVNENIDVKLIVLDTLARCFAGGDENRASEMGAFVRGCDMVKEKTGSTILVIHHTGKDASKNARGSSSLTAACDFEFKIKRVDKEKNGKEIILMNSKMKDDEPAETQAFTLINVDIGKNEMGDTISSLLLKDVGYKPSEIVEIVDSQRPENQRLVLSILRDNKDKLEITRKFINEKFRNANKPTKNVSRTIEQLIHQELIVLDPDSGFIHMINP
jgi:hypothetical protein